MLRFAWHVDAGLVKRQSIEGLLADPDDHAARYGDIRALAGGHIRTVKINDDGTW